MVDTSQLAEYQDCPRRYKYRYIDGIAGFEAGVEAQFSTHLVHRPLAGWYRAGGLDYRPEWSTMWKAYVDVVKLPPGWLSLKLAQEMFEKYISQFASDFELYEVIHVEKMLSTSIEGFGVKPDVGLRRRKDGSLLAMDHKISKYEKTSLVIDRQFRAQADAVGATGVIINRYQIGGKGDWFREHLSIPTDLLEEWRWETNLSLDVMKISSATGIYPAHAPHACQKGRWTCPALHICEAGKLRQSVIDRLPKVEDPLAYQKEDEAA